LNGRTEENYENKPVRIADVPGETRIDKFPNASLEDYKPT
jgi:hypothetical protein